MAITARRPSGAETYEFIPEVWSAKVLNHVRSYLVSMNVVNTEFRSDLVKGDNVYIPVLTTLSSGAVDSSVTAAINTNTVQTTFGEANAAIPIDHWEECPVQIDDAVKAQTHLGNLLALAADNAAYALEKSIDSQVHVLFSSLGSAYANADGSTFTDDTLITMMETLDASDVPSDNRSLVGDPSMMADLYKIDKYMSYDYSKRPLGQQGGAVGGTGGFRGTIVAYNLPVFVTNHLTDVGTGNAGALLHRDAIGLVIQDGPTIAKARVESAASDLIYVRALWGEAIIRDAFGVPFYTRSA